MNRWWIFIFALLIIIIVGTVVLVIVPAPSASAPTTASSTPVTANNLSDTINVDTPLPNTAVQSPLHITGKARGTFYFEASFPVKLLDASGNVLAQAPAQAQSDWMTADFVPFTVTLAFVQPAPGTAGTLELTNDNPSGDPANQKTLDIPVRF